MSIRRVFLGLAALTVSAIATPGDIEVVTGEDLPALGPYVPATVANGVVYTAGQIAFDVETGMIVGEDVRTQTRKALENLRTVLAAAGSSMKQTLRVNVYLKNPEDFPAMNEVYQEYFKDHKPARTTIPGVEWGKGVLVEIDAIALRIED